MPPQDQDPNQSSPSVVPAPPSGTPVAQSNNATASDSSALFSCTASYVTGRSGFSYHPGTLYLYQDRLAVRNGSTPLLEIPYSDISRVEYRKRFLSNLFTIQTPNGARQIAPFVTLGSSPWKLFGVFVGVIALDQLLIHLGGIAEAIAIPVLLFVGAISITRTYRKQNRVTRQILSVLGQHVSIVSR